VSDPGQRERFERLMLPHLDAAYTLARWLTGDEERARDAVQEGYFRALRFFGSFRGEDGRPWLLRIVRNACYELRQRDQLPAATAFDEEALEEGAPGAGAVVVLPVNPEAAAIERSRRDAVHRCMRELPVEYREALVLRELHGHSYREIASISGVPIGTVMSRLARGRRLLLARLAATARFEETGT
jgi:RNA polymerase sigma-70 factor, ECF subfamily